MIISPLKVWVQNILPVVYDDSLSYLEIVAKINAKTNEIISQTNENTKAIETLASVIAELGNIDELKELLDEVKTIVEDLYTVDAPLMDGVANAGSADHAARSDHVHPSDTSKANKDLGISNGNANQYVKILSVDEDGKPTAFGGDTPSGGADLSDDNPKMDGSASAGSSTKASRADHVHPSDTTKLNTNGDGSNVTTAFTVASSRTNIITGEKLTVIFGKIAKWFTDLGTAAFRAATSNVTSGSSDLIESGAVFTALNNKVNNNEFAIAITGALPSMAVSAGQYVIVRNSTITGVTDGLYIAVNNLSPSTNVSATDLTAVSNGGLNDLLVDVTPVPIVITQNSTYVDFISAITSVKIGRLAVISLTFSVSSEVPNLGVLFTGLPQPLNDWGSLIGQTGTNNMRVKVTGTTLIADGPGPAGWYSGVLTYPTLS